MLGLKLWSGNSPSLSVRVLRDIGVGIRASEGRDYWSDV